MFASKQDAPSILKVCVTGPESTGKSELSKFLAETYRTSWVPEYARNYLDKLNRPYQQSDLSKIAHGQMRLEDEWVNESNRVLICDTNLITIKIWSEFKFGKCEEEILHQLQARKYDLYLLCYIDLPWENDPQREHPDKREELWNLYKAEVTKSGVPFVEIAGEREARRKRAIDAINSLL